MVDSRDIVSGSELNNEIQDLISTEKTINNINHHNDEEFYQCKLVIFTPVHNSPAKNLAKLSEFCN